MKKNILEVFFSSFRVAVGQIQLEHEFTSSEGDQSKPIHHQKPQATTLVILKHDHTSSVGAKRTTLLQSSKCNAPLIKMECKNMLTAHGHSHTENANDIHFRNVLTLDLKRHV